LQERLWPFLDGIAREHDLKALMIGGMEDHTCMLLSLPSIKSTAFTMTNATCGIDQSSLRDWTHFALRSPGVETPG
jgi:hypothetical protein